VSSRHTRSFFGVMLAVVFALSAVVVAPASAKLTKHQKAHIRKQLKRAIHKSPKLIRSKSFIKKASLVDFKLPVTIQLRGINPTTGANPNRATIDLGTSLGSRQINLGGKLRAEIQFHDSFDGGALGNVDLAILPSTNTFLTSTSIPLLWNPQVSDNATTYAASLLGNTANEGCGDFTTAGNTGLGFGPFTQGVPYYDPLGFPANYPASPTGFVPEKPGPDAIDLLTNGKIPGDPNQLGGSLNPFPAGGPTATPPSVKDTVLRTGPLQLSVPAAGTEAPVSGVDGSQTNVIGQSGGQANLFGDIPGKPGVGVDVTVNLGTKINSIIREVAPDAALPLLSGTPYPAAAFSCRQAWTGTVQNYIPGVRLAGTLHISPAITPTGQLRIAKANLSSLQPDTIALAACLSPESVFAPSLNGSDGSTVNVPGTAGVAPDSVLPIDDSSTTGRAAPTHDCNAFQTTLLQDANFHGVPAITPGDGYNVTNDGSKVSVAGQLTVNNVDADVYIGDV
jgi:hypothetical protein